MLILLRNFCFFAALIVACAPCISAAAGATLRAADDFSRIAAEARGKRVPVLVAFMEQRCPYCATARRDHLLPLQNDPQWRDKMLIRTIEVDRNTALRDFSGAQTTHREFARKHKVKRVPTLIVFDGDGKAVAEPIVGLLISDYYRLYIEQAVEAGLVRMRPR